MIQKLHQNLYIAIFFLLPGTLYANDLLQTYHIAQNNDPTFESARFAFAAARQKLPQSRAGLLPVINLNANENNNYASSNFNRDPAVYREVNSWSVSLQLTQPLFRAQNYYAYNESERLEEQAVSQYHQAEDDLILRVTDAYFGVLIAQESIEVADAQVNAAEVQLSLATHGYSAGLNTITDVNDAQSKTDLARAQRIQTINDLESKHADLEKILGTETKSLSPLKTDISIPRPQPENASSWQDKAKEQNHAVLAARSALAAADVTVLKSRSDHAPTLDLVASHGVDYSSGSVSTPTDMSTYTHYSKIGIQFSLPLYAGGGTNAHVSEALSNLGRATAELEVARRKAGSDAKQAYSAIINGLAQIKALESSVTSSESAAKGKIAGYKLGTNMIVDVLNAQQQLYTAKRDLVKARYETIMQIFKLKAAAGTLSEEDIWEANQLLVRN